MWGRVHKKHYIRNCLTRRLRQFAGLTAGLAKKREGVQGSLSGFDNLCTQHMYIPLSYRYLGMIGILWYPRGILFVSKTYKSDPSQTRFPVVFVLKNLLYPTILKKLSLVSKLLGNSLDKWF